MSRPSFLESLPKPELCDDLSDDHGPSTSAPRAPVGRRQLSALERRERARRVQTAVGLGTMGLIAAAAVWAWKRWQRWQEEAEGRGSNEWSNVKSAKTLQQQGKGNGKGKPSEFKFPPVKPKAVSAATPAAPPPKPKGNPKKDKSNKTQRKAEKEAKKEAKRQESSGVAQVIQQRMAARGIESSKEQEKQPVVTRYVDYNKTLEAFHHVAEYQETGKKTFDT